MSEPPSPVIPTGTSSLRDPQQKTPIPILVLAWIAAGAVLYLGKPALAPVLFAIVLAMLLSPLVDALERWRLPRSIASLVSVGILITCLGLVTDAALSPALKWINDAPVILQAVERKIRPLQRTMARVDAVTSRANSLTHAGSSPVARMPDTSAPINALALSRTVLIDMATISILTIFLLAGGVRTLRGIERTLDQQGRHYQSLRIVESVRNELSRHFATLALINIGLGLVVTGVVAIWGLPSPWLWGVMVAVLNFIPYAGPTLALFILAVVSLVSFDGYAPALGVAGSFLLITTIEGQIIQPLLLGFRLNLNPIILFVATWLGGWFWGVTGVVLATPVLIALKEIANHQVQPSLLKAFLNTPDSLNGTLRIDSRWRHADSGHKQAPEANPPSGATDSNSL